MQENIYNITEKISKIESETNKKQQELHETMELVRNYEHDLSKKINSLEIIKLKGRTSKKDEGTATLLDKSLEVPMCSNNKHYTGMFVGL